MPQVADSGSIEQHAVSRLILDGTMLSESPGPPSAAPAAAPARLESLASIGGITDEDQSPRMSEDFEREEKDSLKLTEKLIKKQKDLDSYEDKLFKKENEVQAFFNEQVQYPRSFSIK